MRTGWIYHHSTAKQLPHLTGTLNAVIGDREVSFEPDNRFMKDKVFGQVGDFFYLIDGVVLNWEELRIKLGLPLEHTDESLNHYLMTVAGLHEKDPAFYSDLEGTFTGLVVNTFTGDAVAFTNKLGERPVFYSSAHEGVLSSSFGLMRDALLAAQVTRTLDTLAVRSMVVFGGMHDDRTYIEQVSRLLPGHAVTLDSTGCRTKRYHLFDTSSPQEGVSEDEWIERLDESFTRALSQGLDKDASYGRTSLIDISGGLDSRMVTLVAKRLGYENVHLMSYSAAGSVEQRVTEQVVTLSGYPFINKTLDDALFLLDVSRIVELNFGLTVYSGITGGERLLSMLNKEIIGLEHTGIQGEMASGGYIGGESKDEYRLNGAIDAGPDHQEAKSYYPNPEMFSFYTRGPLWAWGSSMVRRAHVDTVSPFGHSEFLEVSHEIPEALRLRGHIFLTWMKRCYPEAADIPYSNDMVKPAAPEWVKGLAQRRRRAYYLSRAVLQKVFPAKAFRDPHNMNPFEYWYRTDERMSDFIDTYLDENLDLIRNHPELSDIYQYFSSKAGNVTQKTALMTALEAIRQYVL